MDKFMGGFCVATSFAVFIWLIVGLAKIVRPKSPYRIEKTFNGIFYNPQDSIKVCEYFMNRFAKENNQVIFSIRSLWKTKKNMFFILVTDELCEPNIIPVTEQTAKKFMADNFKNGESLIKEWFDRTQSSLQDYQTRAIKYEQSAK